MSNAAISGSHAEPFPIAGKNTPILWWAGIGACFVALQLYIYGSWIGSEHFKTTQPGDSVLPSHLKPMLLVIQVGASAWFLMLFTWLVRNTLRYGRLPTLGLVILGWTSAIWQDPLINYVRPGFSYNSYFVNFGSWCELVPGWLSPNGSHMPEPIFFDCGAYMVVIPLTVLICANAMRRAKRIWPGIGSFQLILVALATMFVCDLAVEGLLCRTGVYAYMGSIASLSLWGGHWYQFPLYESMLGGAVTAAVGSLFYFRDDKGNTLVERGLDSLKAKRGREVLRVLAVSGFINVVVLTYTVLFIQLNLHLDAWPKDVPSYLRNGLCGEGTDYECPGPGVAIPLRNGARKAG